MGHILYMPNSQLGQYFSRRSGELMDRRNNKNQRLIALFILGCLLFNFPLLSIFNEPRTVLGIPLLYVYVFVAWLALIGLTIIVIERSS
jgi:hypothetical protein